MINRVEPPPITDAVKFKLHLKPYQKFHLKNGVEVYAIDAGTEEVLQVDFVFFAGNCYEDQNLIAATTNYLLLNGTQNKNAFQISECIEYFGASVSRACFNETATLTLHCLTKHFENLLPILKEVLTTATFPEQELEVYKQNMKQRLQVNEKKSDFIAGRLIDTYLFGEKHAYGKYSTANDYDALNITSLQNFYTQFYNQGKCKLFIAGKLPQNLETLLNQYFTNLPNNTISLIEKNYLPAAQKKYQIINDENNVQGSVRLARPFPNRHHPDFLKAQVLNCILGGYFGSRLMSNIREEKGYTYGIHSYIQNHIQRSAWMVSTEAGKEVCNDVLKEIYAEMKLLRTAKVKEEELHLVKNFLIGSILADLDGPFHIISRWKNIILNNLNDDYFLKSIDAIKNITADELQNLAKQYLVPEDFYELIVI